VTDLIAEMADRLFAAHSGNTGLWAAVEEAGLPFALLAEEAGGFGFAPAEALGIIRIAAGHAAAAPVAETVLANHVLGAAGLDPAEGAAVVATEVLPAEDGRLCGTLRRLPWARDAGTVVALTAEGRMLRLTAGWSIRSGSNLAGEPRDDLTFDLPLDGLTTAESPFAADTLLAMSAALRAIAIAGAAEAALALTVGYVNDRVQFGRPIGKQQAIQQNLAVMAGQTAAARAAADMVSEAFPLALSAPELFRLKAGAAKLRAGEAAGVCAAIAHQAHGAIGITREYRLHPLTRRLWSWRDEFGSEAFWAERIGAAVFARGDGGLWPWLTRTGEAA
jgi:acyl-CoA dehydrogenase